eukprot:TRINITY_DN12875_c0_g2_i1.p1 TRINITY_DN12875_c0_g2~~TRINITY_DN12875_c0_g2_i1.p1  ORF type:complete len:285 (+),score=46.49 TRINITY_DN12875_c0_g2_i1:168-1022(+)
MFAAPSHAILLNGDTVDLENDEYLAEARERVAVLCGVSPTQIVFAYGTRVLHNGSMALRELRPSCDSAGEAQQKLTAVVTARPVEAAIVPRGAGFYRYQLRKIEERQRIYKMPRDAANVPQNVSVEAWIAAKTCTVFEDVVRITRSLDDLCTCATCPRMCAGVGCVYNWADDRHSTPRPLSAPDYLDALITHAQIQLSDTSLVPGDGSDFPERFVVCMGSLLRLLFRAYAHACCDHYSALSARGEANDVTTMFKHFVFFVTEFNLVTRDDMAPLRGLVDHFLSR